MKVHRFVILLVATSFILSGCVQSQHNQKQTLGTLLGAGAGALLGSQTGSGKGKLFAVAIATLGGAFLGGEIGKSLDEVDRLKAAQAQQSALESNASGISSSWQNPDTGNSGTVTPQPATKKSTGEVCRKFVHEVSTKDGKTEVSKGTACRVNGRWERI